MRALVTNDDGIESVGLLALATVGVQAGLEVVVVAPSSEHSGSSAALTAFESGGRLVMRDVQLDGLGAHRCVAVDATPAFITMAAASGTFGPPPELVLSGINRGPNTGQSILHSGTVGAALTSSTHGCPGVAFSLAASRPTEFGTAAVVVRRVLTWILASAPLPTVVLRTGWATVTPLAALAQAAAVDLGGLTGRIGPPDQSFEWASW